jgi:hypothetical protein
MTQQEAVKYKESCQKILNKIIPQGRRDEKWNCHFGDV